MSHSQKLSQFQTTTSACVDIALETIAMGRTDGDFAKIAIGLPLGANEKTIVKLTDKDVKYIKDLLQNIPEDAQKGTILTLVPCGRVYDKGNQFKVESIEMSDAVLDIIKTVKPNYYGVFTSAIKDFVLLVRRAGTKGETQGAIQEIESCFTPQEQTAMLAAIQSDQRSHATHSAVDQLVYTAHCASMLPFPR